MLSPVDDFLLTRLDKLRKNKINKFWLNLFFCGRICNEPTRERTQSLCAQIIIHTPNELKAA